MPETSSGRAKRVGIGDYQFEQFLVDMGKNSPVDHDSSAGSGSSEGKSASITAPTTGEEARKANIFGRTSFFTKTVYDPYVNMLRSTTEAFSAVVGGVDGLSVSCFDEAIRMGDEFSRRVARNSQIMLQEEYSLLQPVDPAGGSWYLETLTDTLARKIWETIQEVEREGGMLLL